MDADYTAREKILVHGLADDVQLLAVHEDVRQENPDDSIAAVQAKTLDLIRSLVTEGFFDVGTLPHGAKSVIVRHNIDEAVREISHSYIDHFDNDNWEYEWWLTITPKGERVAEPLAEAYRRDLNRID